MDKQIEIPSFKEKDKVEAQFHNFEQIPSIVGKLKFISQGTYGNQYVIDTPDGDVTVGTYGVLSSKITKDAIGKWIKIEFKGNQKSPKTGRIYHDFDVYLK